MPVQTMKDQLLPVTKALLYTLIEIQKKMHVSSTKYLRSSYTVDLKNFKAGLDKLTHKICDPVLVQLGRCIVNVKKIEAQIHRTAIQMHGITLFSQPNAMNNLNGTYCELC